MGDLAGQVGTEGASKAIDDVPGYLVAESIRVVGFDHLVQCRRKHAGTGIDERNHYDQAGGVAGRRPCPESVDEPLSKRHAEDDRQCPATARSVITPCRGVYGGDAKHRQATDYEPLFLRLH